MPAQNYLSGALLAAFTLTVSFAQAANVPRQNGYIDAAIQQHNLHRANHSAAAIQWDATIANIAQNHALLCDFEHTQ